MYVVNKLFDLVYGIAIFIKIVKFTFNFFLQTTLQDMKQCVYQIIMINLSFPPSAQQCLLIDWSILNFEHDLNFCVNDVKLELHMYGK